jgi:hypothetical protein
VKGIKPLGPVFDKQVWRILATSDRVEFRPGFCNEVEIATWDRPDSVARSVRILVPADLFAYLRACGRHYKQRVRLLLLKDGQGKYRFCVQAGKYTEWLWTYPDLPVWAES